MICSCFICFGASFSVRAQGIARVDQIALQSRDELEARLATLPPLQAAGSSERIGFHGPHLESPEETTSVSLRLANDHLVDTVALVPVQRPVGGDTLINYGFPLRYRIDGRSDASQAWKLLVDQTEADVVLNAAAPVLHRIKPQRLVEIRIVVTAPWKRAPSL